MAWKGWLIDESLRDKSIIGKLSIIDSFTERNEEGDKLRVWKLNVVEVADKDMNSVVKKLEKILKETKFGAVKFKADRESLGKWKSAFEYGTKKAGVDQRYIVKVV